MGTLDEHRATRGVLVTTSAFTSSTVAFAKKMARLELVDRVELCRRFNAVLGPGWNVARIRDCHFRQGEAGRKLTDRRQK